MPRLMETIEAKASELLPRDKAVLAAVSGGLDSMALLHALYQLSGKYNWLLMVAHFNHRLRGRASQADQQLVEKTAKQLGIQCINGSWGNDKKLIKDHGPEMAARLARHNFLAETARAHDCRIIVMAHHLNDQAETFLWRMLRGAGGKGLSGMREQDSFPGYKKLKIVRPVLQLTKQDLREFAEDTNIQFREDASNNDLRFLRNRIRKNLLPTLRRDFHQDIELSINQSQGLIRADADFVSDAAKKWLKTTRRPSFNKLHVALQRWVIWHQLIEHGIVPQYDQIEKLRQLENKSFPINPHQTLERDSAGAVRMQEISKLTFRPEQLNLLPTRQWTEVEFSNTIFRCRITASKPAKNVGELLDACRVGNKILLRHWRPGDRFQPIGMSQSVKLQNLFTNAKVPANEKRHRILACTEKGQLFWIQKFRISDLAKITPKTKRFLQWHCQSV